MHVGIREKFGVMQQDRRIVSTRIQSKPTNQLYREASDIMMHQVKHADNCSEGSKAFAGLEDGYRMQGAPSCDGMRSCKGEFRIVIGHGQTLVRHRCFFIQG